MDTNNLCLIEKKNNRLIYTIYKKLLNSSKKEKVTEEKYILNFIKNEYVNKN